MSGLESNFHFLEKLLNDFLSFTLVETKFFK